MKRIIFSAACISIILAMTLALFTACADKSPASVTQPQQKAESESAAAPSLPPPVKGVIYLYGEQHAVDKIVDKEFELWSSYYHGENMRNLFLELPYYTAEFLNAWMQAEGNDLLDAVYNEWEGAALQSPKMKEFFEKIKRECPETIFTGTDVGHQYDTTGERFLRYLEENGKQDSPQYRMAQDNIEQGKRFMKESDNVYRENTMAQNFIRAFDALGGESVMGIYGSAHTDPEAMEYTTGSVPGMAKQLHEKYGDRLYTEDLSWLAKDIDPYHVEVITINGKAYDAAYFGKMDISSFSQEYEQREVWRLQNAYAYDDFKDFPALDNVLPHDNYPMSVGENEVFVWDYIRKDGSVKREYHRTTDELWQGKHVTQEFAVQETKDMRE